MFAGVVTLAYGWFFGPPFAARDPLIKATATLGLLLILVGWMQWHYGAIAHGFKLPSENHYLTISGVRVTWTQLIGIVFPIIVTAGTPLFLRKSKLGTAMRALANDREITSMLGVPVRRVETVAWFGSGIICGIAGLLLSQLVGLDIDNTHLLRDLGARGRAHRPAEVALGHADRRVRHRPRAGGPRHAQHDLDRLGRVPVDDAVRAGDHRHPVDGSEAPSRGADLT